MPAKLAHPLEYGSDEDPWRFTFGVVRSFAGIISALAEYSTSKCNFVAANRPNRPCIMLSECKAGASFKVITEVRYCALI